MAFCDTYLRSGACLKSNCRDEHVYVTDYVRSELDCAIKGRQWPLSCFGPFPNSPCIPNYIKDQSFEETRLMYYEPNRNFIQSYREYAKALNAAATKSGILYSMRKGLRCLLINVYNGADLEKYDDEINNPFALGDYDKFKPFGSGNNSTVSEGFFSISDNIKEKEIFKSESPSSDEIECNVDSEEMAMKLNDILDEVKDNQIKLAKQEQKIESIMSAIKKIKLDNPKQKDNRTFQKPANRAYLIKVRPKSKESSQKTKFVIQHSIENEDVQVCNFRLSYGGSVIINCNNLESAKSIQSQIGDKLSDDYKVHLVKLKNPRIFVHGISKETHQKELIEVIRQQNKIEGKLELIHCSGKINQDKYNAVIEVDYRTFRDIIEVGDGNLFIGWFKCRVYEALDVRRCGKCWGFNHFTKGCNNAVVCPKCSGDHEEKRCNSSQLRCINCVKENKRTKQVLNVQHDVRRYTCPQYLKHLQWERKFVNYFEE